MKNICLVLVTDSGFLAPSVQVALQFAKSDAASIADLLLFTVGVEKEMREFLAEYFERQVGTDAIRMMVLDPADYSLPSGTAFFKNHITHTSLGRLVVGRRIPEQYERVLYVDGDIKILGDLTPLLKRHVEDGRIGAVRGSAWLDPHSILGTQPRGYLRALGVAPADYFNAGILLVNRRTIVEEFPAALELFFQRSNEFVRHDQSALNAHFNGRVDHLSPMWNFHSAYMRIDPTMLNGAARIVHFTGSAKPWNSVGGVWGCRYRDDYVELLDAVPELGSVFSVSVRRRSMPRRTSEVLRAVPLEIAGVLARPIQHRLFLKHASGAAW